MCLSHFQNNKYKQTKYNFKRIISTLSLLLLFAIRHKEKTLLTHLRPHTFVMIATAQKRWIEFLLFKNLLNLCYHVVVCVYLSNLFIGTKRREQEWEKTTFNKQKKKCSQWDRINLQFHSILFVLFFVSPSELCFFFLPLYFTSSVHTKCTEEKKITNYTTRTAKNTQNNRRGEKKM